LKTVNAGAFARGSYLIGASDNMKEGLFEWCTSDQPANLSAEIKWKANQPDNAGSGENCLNIIASTGTPPGNVVLNDLPCTYKMKYLCEVSFVSFKYKYI